MAQDVSVKSIELMKGYNSRVKTFNTSVNTLIYAFRNQIENIIAEQKVRLHRLERDYDSACSEYDYKIRQLEELLSRYYWHPESEAKIQIEITRLRESRMKLDMMMASIRQNHASLAMQLDQLIQSAATFSQSNQSLLDGNILRMENIIQYIDNYKSTNV